MALKGSNIVAAAIASPTHTAHGALDAMGLASTPIAGTWHVAVTSPLNDLQQFHWSQGSAEGYDGGSYISVVLYS